MRRVTPDQAGARRLADLELAAFPDRTTTRAPEDFIWFANRPDALVLADEDLSRGFLLIQFAAGEGEIHDIGVHPDVRRNGLGRALVQEAIETARQHEATQLFLEVGVHNTPALALYAATGFLEVGRRKGYYLLPEGTRSDALIMSIPVPRAA
ncbi:MAG: ribosomal protein S18-alanine N-acetyltransferase [Pseudomonadota bacterium]